MTSPHNHSRRASLLGDASVRSVGRLLGVASLLAAGSGCPSPDPEGKYERFNEQTEEARDRPEPKLDFGGPVGGTDTDGAFPDITGTFLLAVDTSINPGLPLQFVAEVTADYDSSGTGTVSVEFQPLSLDVGSRTEPRAEVGVPIMVEGDVTEGSFTLDFGMTDIIGAANPITGSDISAVITLMGSVRSEDAWCGSALGDVLSPIQVSLEGSTFGAVRLAKREDLPDDGMFPVSCDTVVVDDE